jgi:hypothetical protein
MDRAPLEGGDHLSCWIGKTGMSSRLGSRWEEVYARSGGRGPNAAGESAVVASVASSCGVPIPTGSTDDWGYEAFGWVSSLGIGSSTLMLPGGVRFGGVAGPRGEVCAGVAGRVGSGLRGGGVSQPPSRAPEGGVGKNSICAGERRHAAWIAGLGIYWIRSWETNVS